MKVTIKLFARFAERAGQPTWELIIEGDEPVTASRIKEELSQQWPDVKALIQQSFLAVNMAYVPDEETIKEGDEIALLPPVSGGEEPLYELTETVINTQSVLDKVISPNHGASLVFVGTTREWTEGMRTVHLEYEAYAPMALQSLKQIGDEIQDKWPGTRTAITHRLGKVDIAETSVIIAVSGPHRGATYEASRYAIERLKEIVPIWKKEVWEDGSEWKGHQTGPWNPLIAKGNPS
jgi:molybdopterin converting factor subunit 1